MENPQELRINIERTSISRANSELKASPERLIAKLNLRIDRLIEYIHQLQENTRPDLVGFVFNSVAILFICATNILDYYDLAIPLLIAVFMSAALALAGIGYGAYRQSTFAVHHATADGEIRLVKRSGSVYELQISES